MKKFLIILAIVVALCIGFVVFMTCGNKKTTAKLIKEYESKGMKVASVEDDLKFDFNDSYKTCELKEVDKDSNFDVVVIPEEVNGYKVTSIAICAFGSVNDIYGNETEKASNVSEVVIPDTVTGIDKWAFQNCKNLKKVVFGKNVEYVGEAVFSGCTLLTDVTLSNSLKDLSKDMFNGCTSLKSIIIPNNIGSIDDSFPFSGCKSLEEIHIPKSVNYISKHFFSCVSDNLTIYAPARFICRNICK